MYGPGEMAKPLTDTERAAIVGALQSGESVRGVAKRIGCSPMTVSNIGKAAHVESVRTFGQKAAEARDAVADIRRDYNLAGRLELLNLGFEKLVNLLASVIDATEMQRWSTAVGILIDKRRLEDGDVTSRTETIADPAVDEFDRRILDLAARRRARFPDSQRPAGMESSEAV